MKLPHRKTGNSLPGKYIARKALIEDNKEWASEPILQNFGRQDGGGCDECDDEDDDDDENNTSKSISATKLATNTSSKSVSAAETAPASSLNFSPTISTSKSTVIATSSTQPTIISTRTSSSAFQQTTIATGSQQESRSPQTSIISTSAPGQSTTTFGATAAAATTIDGISSVESSRHLGKESGITIASIACGVIICSVIVYYVRRYFRKRKANIPAPPRRPLSDLDQLPKNYDFSRYPSLEQMRPHTGLPAITLNSSTKSLFPYPIITNNFNTPTHIQDNFLQPEALLRTRSCPPTIFASELLGVPRVQTTDIYIPSIEKEIGRYEEWPDEKEEPVSMRFDTLGTNEQKKNSVSVQMGGEGTQERETVSSEVPGWKSTLRWLRDQRERVGKKLSI